MSQFRTVLNNVGPILGFKVLEIKFFRFLPLMKKWVSVCICMACLGVSGACFAQLKLEDVIDPALRIERDVELDSLLMRHIRVNKVKDGFDGFRVQLYSGSGTTARQEANDLRAEFMAQHPETPAYLIYQAPNFKVRVGDCRTELDAIRLQRELAYQYPGGFVSRDVVKFPKLAIEAEKEEEDLEPGEFVPND